MSTTDSNEKHNPSDAACVKNGSGTPTRDVVCPICRPNGDEDHSHDYNVKCYCGFVRQYSPRYSFIDWLVAIGVGREVAVRSVASLVEGVRREQREADAKIALAGSHHDSTNPPSWSIEECESLRCETRVYIAAAIRVGKETT